MTSVFPAASAPPDALPSVPLRGVRAPELPSSLVFAHSDAAVADALAQTLAELELQRPLFALGRAGRNLLGRSLVIDCGAQLDCATIVTAGATLGEVDRLQQVAREEKADVIISCGGGQTLDVGKYGAARALLPFFAIPTQASHDGICSPVAVLRGADGRVSSYGARAPAALFVPVHVVSRAPRRTLVSGMADLAANLIAVEDWRWAHRVTGEPYDDYAALLAQSAARLLIGRRHLFAPERPFAAEDVESLVHGLVLSGLAMALAGSSRPCSGPEHLISHAFDALELGSGSHGEQVAVGSVLASRLFGAELKQVVDLLHSIGAPTTPRAIDISFEDAVRALEITHRVRPGRHTLLSRAVAADPEFVIDLARNAWLDSDASSSEGR
jgi:glycerol-1-phosphate dehydrogenase [NAD(P)+]